MEIRLRLDPPRGPLAQWAAKGGRRTWWRPTGLGTEATGLVVVDDVDAHRLVRLIGGQPGHESEKMGVDDGRAVFAYRCACAAASGCCFTHPAFTALRTWGFPEHRIEEVRFEGDRGVARITFPAAWGEEEALVERLVDTAGELARQGAVVSEVISSRDRIRTEARRVWGQNRLDVETLDVAFRAGYYSKPRGCTMDDLGVRLGVSKSAVYHRLNRAVRSAVAAYLADHARRPAHPFLRDDPVERPPARPRGLPEGDDAEDRPS